MKQQNSGTEYWINNSKTRDTELADRVRINMPCPDADRRRVDSAVLLRV